MIAALDVDLVAVQEVDRELDRSGRRDQVGELARRLGWHSVFVPSLLGDPRLRPSAPWPRPASRQRNAPHPLQRSPPEQPDAVRRAARVAGGGDVGPAAPRVALLATTGDVRVTATHLSTLPWRSARQLRCVLGLGCGGQNVVLGDLNLPLALVTAVADGWTAAVAGPTFPACRPWMQLDHVLVRGGGIASVRLGPGPSDHHAVRATVTVR